MEVSKYFYYIFIKNKKKQKPKYMTGRAIAN
jgi:hypothetical protein